MVFPNSKSTFEEKRKKNARHPAGQFFAMGVDLADSFAVGIEPSVFSRKDTFFEVDTRLRRRFCREDKSEFPCLAWAVPFCRDFPFFPSVEQVDYFFEDFFRHLGVRLDFPCMVVDDAEYSAVDRPDTQADNFATCNSVSIRSGGNCEADLVCCAADGRAAFRPHFVRANDFNHLFS